MKEQTDIHTESYSCTQPDKWKNTPGFDASDELIEEYLAHLSECKYHSEQESLSKSLLALLMTEAYSESRVELEQTQLNHVEEVERIVEVLPPVVKMSESKSSYHSVNLHPFADSGTRISVVGVGGGGGNAVNGMIDRGFEKVDFITINCDVQALARTKAPTKIQVGKTLTRGLGAGADPSIGHRAVEEDIEDVGRAIQGSDMVFLAAGMGGGTGTGGSPLVANLAKNLGALVVGVVTTPFRCEGKRRAAQAQEGIEELKKHVDSLIVVPNQKLLDLIDRHTPLLEAFDLANELLYNATRGISELITVPGLINVDFADVRTVMRGMGDALMGSGIASGENRATEAAHAAISSPLLDRVSIAGAQGILINVTGGKNMSLVEVDEATSVIHDAAGDDANVILGTVIDDDMKDEIMVTIIATGFNTKRTVSKQSLKPLSKLIDRIPSGPGDLQKFEEPTFLRRAIEISFQGQRDPGKGEEKSEKADPEKPEFVRKKTDD
jgi:cell division protein FtsZ